MRNTLLLVLTVFHKELRECLRDRRALGASFLYAIFGPVVVGLALTAVARSSDPNEPLRLALAEAERAPSLVHYLQGEGVEITAAAADPFAAVKNGSCDLLLRVGEDYGEDMVALRPARLELYYDGARAASRRASSRARSVLEGYGRTLTGPRLVARGVSPQVVRPFDLEARDLSTPAARAAVVLAMLPIFLLTAAFVGGMNVAIDTTAGERERGTLEGLLMRPVPRWGLAVGKWLAAAVLNGAVVTLTLLIAGWVLRGERLQALEVPLGLGGRETLLILAALLPLAAFAPALQMLVAIFARTFKEAQTYLSLLLFVPVLPGFLLAFDALEPAPWMGLVPIIAQQLAITDVLRGEIVTLLLPGLLTLLATALAVYITGRLLHHERIVLGR